MSGLRRLVALGVFFVALSILFGFLVWVAKVTLQYMGSAPLSLLSIPLVFLFAFLVTAAALILLLLAALTIIAWG